ncbi:MAG: CsgG/HfaB family protein, partial [Candidatus Sericytochromatia bacterium]
MRKNDVPLWKIIKYFSIFFIFFIFCTFPVQAKTIAVLPFDVLSENKEYKQFGLGTMDTITVALTGINEFTLIDRGRLTNILKEQSFQLSGFSDINESVKAGKLLGAQILVTGSIQSFDNQFRITANFIEVETGKILKATNVTGANIFELQDKIAEQIIELENVKLTTYQRNEVTKITKATDSTKAFEYYTVGRTYYYQAYNAFFNKGNKGI